jgi:exosortase/archaeosortase family protein
MVVSTLVAPNVLTLLNQALDENFGAVFPAIPLVALLFVIMVLRLSELWDLLEEERGLSSEASTRLLGCFVIAFLFIARPVTTGSIEASGVAVVLSVYATALVINPLTRRLLLPYALISGIGIGVPSVLQWGLGGPLAAFTSNLSAWMAAAAGLPVTWLGTQFVLLSRSGGVITGTVTSDCSGIVSITAFLALLALLHMDLKKNVRSTIKTAIAGAAVLLLVNSVRIVILLWVGYIGGAGAFWWVHDWIGYVLFLGIYLTALAAYSGVGRRKRGNKITALSYSRQPPDLISVP